MNIRNLIVGIVLLLSVHQAVGQEIDKKYQKTKEVFLIDKVQIYKKFYSAGSYKQLKAGFTQTGATSDAVDRSSNSISKEFDAKTMSNIMSNALVSELIPHRLTGIQLAGQFISKGLAYQILIMTNGSVIVDLSRNKVFKIINEVDRKYVADLVARAI